MTILVVAMTTLMMVVAGCGREEKILIIITAMVAPVAQSNPHQCIKITSNVHELSFIICRLENNSYLGSAVWLRSGSGGKTYK